MEKGDDEGVAEVHNEDETESGEQKKTSSQIGANAASTSTSMSQPPFEGFYFIVFRCFKQTNHPRYLCLLMVTSPWFERISMLVILLNCITLGMNQPCEDDECRQVRCQVLNAFDNLIYLFFLLEISVKIMAMGICGKLGYFHDGWNRLDAFIVFAGILEYIPHTKSVSLTAIRTFRVLRPLRAIKRIPSMRILVMLLLDTLPMLGNVLMLCFFVFFIFGIIGVQLWAGKLRYRCKLDLNETIARPTEINLTEFYKPYPNLENRVFLPKDFVCSLSSSGMQKCTDVPPFIMYLMKPSTMQQQNQTEISSEAVSKEWHHNHGKKYIVCNRSAESGPHGVNLPNNESCVNWNQYYSNCSVTVYNPYTNAINFDNIGYAWVAIFQVISLESWVDIMYYVQDTHTFWVWIYFVALIIIGTFFMLNLCLVVIATQFSETKKRETERMRLERGQSSFSLVSSEPAGCYTEIVQIISRSLRNVCKSMACRYHNYVGRKKGQHREMSFAAQKQQQRTKKCFNSKSTPPTTPTIVSHINECGVSSSPENSNFLVLPPISNKINFRRFSVDSIYTWHSITPRTSKSLGTTVPHQKYPNKFSTSTSSQVELRRSSWTSNAFHMSNNGRTLDDFVLKSNNFVERVKSVTLQITNNLEVEEDHKSNDEDEENEDKRKARKSCQGMIKEKIKIMVHHHLFQKFILFAILCNTIGMGIEYHDQPQTLTDAIEYSNFIFCAIFLIEMICKIIGQGFMSYISEKFNFFDAVIVILSLTEIFQGSEHSGLSVLRTFRLLRIIKLVRFLPALREQLLVMLKTMDNVATFFGLLLLFIFIFSILGMTLFGGKFCFKRVENATENFITCTCAERAAGICQCDRANFDTLLWSLITVFQILTQEDWNKVLYAGMNRTSAWAALYFIFLMTFGNYVLFNLLVAILVEGFSTDRNLRSSQSDTFHIKSETNLMDPAPIPLYRTSHRLNTVTSISTPGLPIVNTSNEENMSRIALPLILHTGATPMPTPQGSPRIETATTKLPCSLRRRHSCDSNASMVVEKHVHLSTTKTLCHFSPSIVSIDRFSISSTEESPAKRSLLSVEVFQHGLAVEQNKSLNVNCKIFHKSSFTKSSNSIAMGCYDDSNLHSNRSLNATSNSTAMCRVAAKPNIKQTRNQNTCVRSWSSGIQLNSENDGGIDNVQPCSISVITSFEEHDVKRRGRKINSRLCKNIKGSARFHGLRFYFPQIHKHLTNRSDYALYIFSPESPICKLCQALIAKKWFDYIIMFFISLNCITLAMERPSIPSDSLERYCLSKCNDAFTLIFTLEMMIKVLAKGLIVGDHAYLKSGWNIMDGFLVSISLIDVLITIAIGSTTRIFGILRVFRILRTLRPLRVISRAPGLKLVVQTLISSLRPIGNIVLICCTFFIIFGILGVQLFKGKFYYCDGPSAESVTNKTQCLQDPRNEWVNRKYNFDNLGLALMALFVVSSKDGWLEIMYNGIDAKGLDQQPEENYNEWLLLYFISFLLLVGFFVLNMFVGVVVENFNKCRENQVFEERSRRTEKLTRRLEKIQRRAKEPHFWRNYCKSRLYIYKVCTSKYFDLIVATIIGVNVISMAAEFYMMPASLKNLLKICNYFFSSIFIIEASLKTTALGLYRYFKDFWNQVDMLIVILSILGIIMEEVDHTKLVPVNPTIIRVMRVLRIARVLKLLKMAKGIRSLLHTVLQALPQVGNLSLLFFLLFFIFAALGVEMFGRLDCSVNNPCVGLGRHAHFEDFGMAYLTLFRIATGDSWNAIMKDTLRDNCDPRDDCLANCCVSHVIAPLYFIVFVLMAQFVLVNVVVAVLMKHLEDSN